MHCDVLVYKYRKVRPEVDGMEVESERNAVDCIHRIDVVGCAASRK